MLNLSKIVSILKICV